MFSSQDLKKIHEMGIELNEIERQLNTFKKGFPFAKILKPALINDGIIRLDERSLENFEKRWNLSKNDFILTKFVPASGAASRMFKSLFEFVNAHSQADSDYQNFDSEQELGSMFYFFEHLENFPFWQDLKTKIISENQNIEELLLQKSYLKILDFILSKKGLNYAQLPKGLIHFHKYPKEVRKAIDEHFVEAVHYAASNQKVQLHFTVSMEDQPLFENWVEKVKSKFEMRYKVNFKVSFSTQYHYTDTIAVDANDMPFRDENGHLILRPGGHGSLIENLNALDADIVFIKNIDNVAPDSLKPIAVKFKRILAGVLLYFKEKIFRYLEQLENVETLDINNLEEIGQFIQESLCILPPEDFKPQNAVQRIKYLYKKLNRPIRVCGMVKSEGEPGGGPFWAENNDRSASLQIIESAQIDVSKPENLAIISASTHFNPVDIVCYLKNHKGVKFDLSKFIDTESVFIAEKSLNGQKIKALERPGLWNGAMADWITIFVEVPAKSFTPVKTIHDLLRKEHQNK